VIKLNNKDLKIEKIIEIFKKFNPQPKSELIFTNKFELLIATILSAQTTDKQVNRVTKKLFRKYKCPSDYINLSYSELEKEINTLGLYRNKSKYIIEASKILLEKYDGRIPSEREELMNLPGVGRKTANVLLIYGFHKNALPVDTHVFRVANRIGLVQTKSINVAEKQLMENVPEKYWINLHSWLILHGRYVCKSRNPKCNNCKIKNYCKYYLNKSL
jgi:endonuclease III